MASVTYDHVTKKFGEMAAVNDLNIKVDDKEFLVLVGLRAAGKPPLCVAWQGWKKSPMGRFLIGDRVVNEVAPKDRDMQWCFNPMPYIRTYRYSTIWLSA